MTDYLPLALGIGALLLSLASMILTSQRANKQEVLDLASKIAEKEMDTQRRLAHLEGRQTERDNKGAV